MLLGFLQATLKKLATMSASSQITDFIPDMIEPVVMPVINTIKEYPYISFGATLLTGGGLLWKNRRSNPVVEPALDDPDIAFAGAYAHNCGLHCIAHTWLSLPEERMRALFESHPIFTTLMARFYDYYQLPEAPRLDDFLKLNEMLSHPFDREILWGPILREHLFLELADVNHYGRRGVDEVMGTAFIPDDRLHLLASAMGATLVVHDTAAQRFNDDILPQEETVYPPERDGGWQIEVLNNGTHYDFTYPSIEQNAAHNRRLREERSLFTNSKIELMGEPIPNEGIQEIVANCLRIICSSREIGVDFHSAPRRG